MEGETDLAAKILELGNDTARLRDRTAPGSQHARLVAELTQAVHARDAFKAIAAHELRNAMTPILGHVEYMQTIGRQRDDRGYPKAVIIALERLAGPDRRIHPASNNASGHISHNRREASR